MAVRSSSLSTSASSQKPYSRPKAKGRKNMIICLVGSMTAGEHQELRIFSQEQKKDDDTHQPETTCVRVSRVNGTDTFQLVKVGDGVVESKDTMSSLEDLPTILELNEFPHSLTVHNVHAEFKEARSLMKYYDQGDCHSLSQMICDKLVPGICKFSSRDRLVNKMSPKIRYSSL